MRVYMACCVVIIISFGSALCQAGCPQEVLHLKRVERSQPFETSRELYKQIAIENREEG